jgi:hypothetical protein
MFRWCSPRNHQVNARSVCGSPRLGVIPQKRARVIFKEGISTGCVRRYRGRRNKARDSTRPGQSRRAGAQALFRRANAVEISGRLWCGKYRRAAKCSWPVSIGGTRARGGMRSSCFPHVSNSEDDCGVCAVVTVRGRYHAGRFSPVDRGKLPVGP